MLDRCLFSFLVTVSVAVVYLGFSDLLREGSQLLAFQGSLGDVVSIQANLEKHLSILSSSWLSQVGTEGEAISDVRNQMLDQVQHAPCDLRDVGFTKGMGYGEFNLRVDYRPRQVRPDDRLDSFLTQSQQLLLDARGNLDDSVSGTYYDAQFKYSFPSAYDRAGEVLRSNVPPAIAVGQHAGMQNSFLDYQSEVSRETSGMLTASVCFPLLYYFSAFIYSSEEFARRCNHEDSG